MNGQTILLFHIEEAKLAQIQELGRILGISICIAIAEEYSQKLGYLAKVDGFRREKHTYTGPEFPGEMLVFSGMNSDEVDRFLAAYRKAGIAPIGLKAVVTPTNVKWTADELFRELMKEHLLLNP